MAYIRVKKIKNQNYAYLVENKNTPSGPRQKVKKYLGKVHVFEKSEDKAFDVGSGMESNGILHNLVIYELKRIGFRKKGDIYSYQNFIFSCKNNSLKKVTQSNTHKEAVISLNKGYLCSFTINRISNFKKTTNFNKDAYSLAKYFMESGLQVGEEDFVRFYQNLK